MRMIEIYCWQEFIRFWEFNGITKQTWLAKTTCESESTRMSKIICLWKSSWTSKMDRIRKCKRLWKLIRKSERFWRPKNCSLQIRVNNCRISNNTIRETNCSITNQINTIASIAAISVSVHIHCACNAEEPWRAFNRSNRIYRLCDSTIQQAINKDILNEFTIIRLRYNVNFIVAVIGQKNTVFNCQCVFAFEINIKDWPVRQTCEKVDITYRLVKCTRTFACFKSSQMHATFAAVNNSIHSKWEAVWSLLKVTLVMLLHLKYWLPDLQNMLNRLLLITS